MSLSAYRLVSAVSINEISYFSKSPECKLFFVAAHEYNIILFCLRIVSKAVISILFGRELTCVCDSTAPSQHDLTYKLSIVHEGVLVCVCELPYVVVNCPLWSSVSHTASFKKLKFQQITCLYCAEVRRNHAAVLDALFPGVHSASSQKL